MVSGVKVTDGTLHDQRDDVGIKDLGVATDTSAQNRCCGMDCCDGYGQTYWRDVQTPHAKYVEYVKGGTKLFVTEAVFLADKAAGFV